MRYFGGKAVLAHHILRHLPPHNVYTEAFCGAASILMSKRRAEVEILSDLDDDVINLMEIVRDRPADLAHALAYTPYAESEYRNAYEPTDDSFEAARRLLVRSHQGIASGDKERRSGFRKYPHNRLNGRDTICASEWSTLPGEVERWAERLRGVMILNGDATWTLQSYDGLRTLHFVDPPYVIRSRKMACKRYAFEMSNDDHRELAKILRGLVGMVVLCGYPSPLYDDLYAGWERIDIPFRGDTECLWRNPAAVKASGRLHQPTIAGFDDLMDEGVA